MVPPEEKSCTACTSSCFPTPTFTRLGNILLECTLPHALVPVAHALLVGSSSSMSHVHTIQLPSLGFLLSSTKYTELPRPLLVLIHIFSLSTPTTTSVFKSFSTLRRNLSTWTEQTLVLALAFSNTTIQFFETHPLTHLHQCLSMVACMESTIRAMCHVHISNVFISLVNSIY